MDDCDHDPDPDANTFEGWGWTCHMSRWPTRRRSILHQPVFGHLTRLSRILEAARTRIDYYCVYIHARSLVRARHSLMTFFLHTIIPFCHVYIFYSSPYHPRSTTLSIRWQFSTHLQLKTPLQYHHHRHTHATPLFTQLRTPTIPSTYYRFLWVCVAFTPCHPFIVL
jgi:hypothetical protein